MRPGCTGKPGRREEKNIIMVRNESQYICIER
jgi:hypothetical protein